MIHFLYLPFILYTFITTSKRLFFLFNYYSVWTLAPSLTNVRDDTHNHCAQYSQPIPLVITQNLKFVAKYMISPASIKKHTILIQEIHQYYMNLTSKILKVKKLEWKKREECVTLMGRSFLFYLYLFEGWISKESKLPLKLMMKQWRLGL